MIPESHRPLWPTLKANARIAPLVRRTRSYLRSRNRRPLFLLGNSKELLWYLPEASFDVCMTSPPYWRQRISSGGGIGNEATWSDYLDSLLSVLLPLSRLVKSSGSLWLSMGDVYENKSLLGLPWRTANHLADHHGWKLRNAVVWHKKKGCPDSAKDRLRCTYDLVFHLTRSDSYYYDSDAIRSEPSKPCRTDHGIKSATGASGARYRKQIEASKGLTPTERKSALEALDALIAQMRTGSLGDFRMVIRGSQRVTHSESPAVSGRAKELAEKGFYVLRYYSRGSKPGDVWTISPEGTHNREGHYAAYPEALCRMPILATCPPGGTVLDPFSGTGTTNLATWRLGRKSVGIEINEPYLQLARRRLEAAEQKGRRNR